MHSGSEKYSWLLISTHFAIERVKHLDDVPCVAVKKKKKKVAVVEHHVAK